LVLKFNEKCKTNFVEFEFKDEEKKLLKFYGKESKEMSEFKKKITETIQS